MKTNLLNDNIHSGHRARLLELANKSGISNLTEIQQLELLLTFIIPRKDTNPIAHNLLKEFSTFAGVLDADISLLSKIDGISERSAKLIKTIPEFFGVYKTSKLLAKAILSTKAEMREYIATYLEDKNSEQFYAMAIDQHLQVLGVMQISHGTDNMVIVDQKDIIKFISKYETIKYVLVGHNHPDSPKQPSQNDMLSTKNLARIFSTLGIKFVDHIIVGKDGLYSFEQSGLL